jgi:hypothetical protein
VISVNKHDPEALLVPLERLPDLAITRYHHGSDVARAYGRSWQTRSTVGGNPVMRGPTGVILGWQLCHLIFRS